jgi:glycosyltransferase involved in cell wall biosynthesis
VLGNGVFTFPALALARLRRPVLVIVHDIVERPQYRWIVRLCRPAVKRVVVPSDAAARPLQAFGLQITVVPNGTTWPVPAARLRAKHPPVVGELAALTPPKAQDILLEAVANLGRRDVHVDLAGEALEKDERYVRRLQDRAANADLRDRVRFLGRVEDPLALLRGWTVAALPSTYPESFGLVLVEAMSVGVPVVATDRGGPSEVVGDAGLLVPPGDVAALAAAIERLIDDQALRRRCRDAGRRAVESSYTVQRQQETLLTLLRQLARCPGGTAAGRGH